jgi:AraC-like DNA-binding protein/ligand-binding sensor protein
MSDTMTGRPAFDLAAALSKLGHYCRGAGVGGALVDDEGQVLGLVDAPEAAEGDGEARPPLDAFDGTCPVCRLLGVEEAKAELRAHLYGAYQAERFGGKYIHLCPHSLLHWIAPIVSDGALCAAFIGGPVLVVEPAEILADLAAAGRLPPGEEDAVLEALRKVPRIAPPRASSLAELLADAAAIVGGALPGRLEATRQRDEQQARIAEFIQELKAEEEPGGAAYPIAKERELLGAISRGDKPESQRLLNEILGHIFFASGQNPAVIRARALELVVLISRSAIDGGADVGRIFDLDFTYLNQIQKMRSVDDIAHWLSRVMVRFSDLVFNLADVKHADVIMKALRLINARFTEPITLDEVAEAVSLSPTYFSKIWNEEMKCRFTVYLNRLRIERGKLLLRTSDTPLVEIAGILGYEDQSYFTKVFKKIVGISPGRYRESGGRVPGLSGRNEEIHGN